MNFFNRYGCPPTDNHIKIPFSSILDYGDASCELTPYQTALVHWLCSSALKCIRSVAAHCMVIGERVEQPEIT